MCSTNERNLSLNGDTFEILKEQFDKILNRTVGNMEMKGADDAVITLKLSVSLEKSSVTVGDDIKEVTKPTFKHDISSVMQVKDKVSGQTTDDYALVWDENENKYVLRKIENGQMSFDDFDANGNPIYDADYHEVPAIGEGTRGLPEAAESDGTADGEDTSDEADDTTPDASGEFGDGSVDPAHDPTTPFGWLRQFIGESMNVTEAMGNYTVRTQSNKVVLSSATGSENPFYCPAEKLSPHVGHAVVCVGYGGEEIVNISIECEDCNEVLFDINAPGANDGADADTSDNAEESADVSETDGYEYDKPEEE